MSRIIVRGDLPSNPRSIRGLHGRDQLALSAGRGFIVGDHLTLADVCFVAELALFHNEKPRARELKNRGLEPILSGYVDKQSADAMAHFTKLSKHPAFAPDMDPYMQKIERTTARSSDGS
jgi:glutathione S-transferase